MPSKSKAQHKYIAMKAGEGEEWAKEWMHKDKGKMKGKPEHVKKEKKKHA
jgi:hypothetical protein